MKIMGKIIQFIKKENVEKYLLPQYTKGRNVMAISPEDYPYPFTVSNFLQRILRRKDKIYSILTDREYKEGAIIEIEVNDHETTGFKEEIYESK